MTAFESPPRPYKGLAPFEDVPNDTLFFFGREREREIIVANLLASRLTVLYGPTGVGKSSLLRAGVTPAIRALPDATVAIFSEWSEDPTAAIDDAVAAARGDVFLVLDQIEEYFVYHDRHAAFSRRLPELVLEPGLRVNVLLGVREDALAKLDLFKSSIPNVLANYLRLDHLDRASARSAVVEPLARLSEVAPGQVRYAAEPELVEAVLDQVAAGRIEYGLSGRGVVAGRDEPPRIEAPFLQLVLERLWDTEQALDSRVLRRETLDSLGGAETIVRRHLEGSLGALEDDQRALAAEMFGHLVTPSGTKIAHDVDDLARYAVADEPAVRDVLARLERDRIVRPVGGGRDGGRYEIFHDVLAEGVLAWRTQFEAEGELARERARRKRAISFAGVALLGLVGVTAVAIFALVQREHARDVSRRAQARELAARANLQLTIDPLRSVALARRAAELEPTAYVERQLRDAVSLSHVRAIFRSRGGPVTHVGSTLGGTRLAVVSASGSIRIVDARTAQEVASVRHPSGVVDAAFSRDGRVLVTLGQDGRARIVEPSSGRVLHELQHDGALTTLALSPDAETVLTGSSDGAGTLWRTATGERLLTVAVEGPVSLVRFDPAGERIALATGNAFHVFRALDGRAVRSFEQRGTVLALDFSSGGRLVAAGGADKVARVWQVSGGGLVHTLTQHVGRVVDVAFNRQGSLLATASTDGTARVWSVATGGLQAALLGHRSYVNTVRFSRGGLHVVTASRDGSAQIWSAEIGKSHRWLRGHIGNVRGAVFAAGGERVITWGDDGTARLWETSIEPELGVVARHRGPVTTVAFGKSGSTVFSASEDGQAVLRVRGRIVRRFPHGAPIVDAVYRPGLALVVTAGTDGVARIWRRAGDAARELRHGAALRSVAVSPDGSQVVTTGNDRRLVIWATGSGARLRTLRHRRLVEDVAFDPSGERIATAGADGVIRIWTDGRVVRELRGHRDAVTGVAFAPGGSWLASSSRDHDARVWNAQTGRPIRVLAQHSAIVSDVSFSPDGRWVATAGPSNVNLWPLRGGGLPIPLRGNQGAVLSVAFAPDGRRVVSGGLDRTVRAHLCAVCGRLPTLITLAERRLVEGRPR